MTSGNTLVILATASLDSQLEVEVNGSLDLDHLPYRGLPKALYPISGRPLLSYTYSLLKTCFQTVIIVTNAHNDKHFERWASGSDCPRDHVVNVGFSHCYIEDLRTVQRVKQCPGDIVVMMSDILIHSESSRDALIEALTTHATDFIVQDETTAGQHLAFYVSKQRLQDQPRCEHHQHCSHLPPNQCLNKFLKNAMTVPVSHDPAYEFMSKSIGFQDYRTRWATYCSDASSILGNDPSCQREPIHIKAHARVGLMGNPSDGFYGKTISLLISNFWAEAILIPNIPGEGEFSAVSILPNPAVDPHRFSTLQSLATQCQQEGYSHGDRLLLACCKVFFSYCHTKGIPIQTRQGFRLHFDTNVPRQVGLAGSSAIITAVWKALLQFYHLSSDDISLAEQASLVLSVEQDELGIAAGLQDRVIQAYEGLVYMDFDKQHMDEHGYGIYERLDPASLPPLWLAYVADPKDSGKVHSSVKQRFQAGDLQVIEAMRGFAALADHARAALATKDHRAFAQLMEKNFELRRQTYGDDVVGDTNLQMVAMARQHRCVAKLPGSGGAVVGMWCGEDEQTRKEDLSNLRAALERKGFVFVDIIPMNSQVE